MNPIIERSGNDPAERGKPGSSRYYRPELDVVRFLAFMLVFTYHTLPSSQDPRVVHILKRFAPTYDALSNACIFGLSLFFTLSAFLICELLLRERQAAGTVGVKKFYIRRILRIWPLYYFGVLLGVAAAFAPGVEPGSAIKMGWFAIFMGAWYCAVHGGLKSPANVLWSVSVEEQFYLFAPWVMKYLNRKSLYGFCVALVLISNGSLYYLGKVSASHPAVWYNSFVQFECFAGGILLCLALGGRMPKLAAWQRIPLLALGFGGWFFACYRLHTIFGSRGEHNPGSWALIGGYGLASLGSVLVLIAFLGIRSNLLPAWAIYLGRISFGLYVFHDFAIYLTNAFVLDKLAAHKNIIAPSLEGPIYLLNMGLTLGLTIGMASLSYRYLETPFLKMKTRIAVIESEPVGPVSTK
jgi:peptidoglycan/LPS O-acetylase OafA/YrhL